MSCQPCVGPTILFEKREHSAVVQRFGNRKLSYWQAPFLWKRNVFVNSTHGNFWFNIVINKQYTNILTHFAMKNG